MIEPISTSSQSVLDLIKYSTAVMSVLMSTLAVFVLCRCRSYATSEYRRLLIAVTVVSALNDLYLYVFLDAVFMVPLPCLYTDGLLDRLFKLPPSKCCEIWVSGLALINIPYLLCVLHRNQILLPPFHPLRLSSRLKFALVLLLSSIYLSLGPLLEFSVERSDTVIDSYFERLSGQWPASMRNRTECIVPSAVYVTLGTFMAVLGGSYTLFLLICSHTLYTLSQLKIISRKTRDYHQRLTKSLIFQMIIPCVTLLLPEAGFLLQHIIHFESPEFSPLMMNIHGAHTIVHSLTVLYSTDYWRNHGKNMGKSRPVTSNTIRSGAFATELTVIK